MSNCDYDGDDSYSMIRHRSIPLDELTGDGIDEVRCALCEHEFSGNEEVFYDGTEHFCEICLNEEIERIKPEAIAFAAEHCKLTRKPEVYDPRHQYAPTPEEYNQGCRDAYTANAVWASNRHNCTNYDELIRPLDRNGLDGQVYYIEIRAKVEELLAEEDDDPVPAPAS